MEEKQTVRQKVKNHFKKHKGKYITGGICLAVGGGLGVLYGDKIKNQVRLISVNIGKDNTIINNITNITNVTKKGHPGNKIMCNETKELFDSQSDAAKTLKLNPSKLSQHMNGKKPTVDGYTFTKMVPEESQK